MNDPALIEIERELEIDALDAGIVRYRRDRLEGGRAVGTAEQQIIYQHIDALSAAIRERQEFVMGGGSARGLQKWGIPLLSLDADKLALLTLVTAFNHADDVAKMGVTRVCCGIGSAANVERSFDELKGTAPNVFARWSKRVQRNKASAVRQARKRAGMASRVWASEVQAHLGAELLRLLLETCPSLFYIHTGRRGVQIVTALKMQPELRDRIESMHGDLEVLRPVFLPMVIPPTPWTTTDDGGYMLHRLPICKPSSWWASSPLQVDMQDNERMSRVFAAVNYLQDTAFSINTTVLEAGQELWDRGGGVAGLPERDQLPLPPKPDDIDTNEEARREWRMKASMVYDKDASLQSNRKTTLFQLKLGSKFRDRRIWIPKQCDWRGRMYDVPSHLHYQAADLGRGMLQFADPLPLGESGFYWLVVHAANCLGFDKLPFEERIDSVARMSSLRQKDHWDDLSWQDADEPFKALAALEHIRRALDGRPWPKDLTGFAADYLCPVPVAMDGSCNGLQHLSALGRDTVGGAAVNLIPSSRPQDVYQQVADRCEEILDRDLEDPEKHAQAARWVGNVTRKTVKRTTMTVPYNVTKQGAQRTLISDGHADSYDEARYLRDVIWEAIADTVIAARRIMDWLVEVARVATDAGYPVTWVTPVGWPVAQEYLTYDKRTVRTLLQTLTLKQPSSDPQLLGTKQQRGLPPNFIHSLDAAHMMLTALACKREGIPALATVHDSFACHPCHVDLMHACIRQEFVDMHRMPLLERLADTVSKITGEVLPDIPPYGTLDIEDVLDSPYFFH